MSRTKLPPSNEDAEAAVLGAVLMNPRALDNPRVARLVASDFNRPDHQHAWDAVRSLTARGDPADAVTLAQELRREGVVDDPEALVTNLQAAPPATASGGQYAAIVAECAAKRRVIAMGADLSKLGYDPARSLDDVARAIRDGLAEFESLGADDEGAVDVAAVVDSVLSGEDPGPWPTMLTRSDGRPLLYGGGAVILTYGLGGSGKSILAGHVAAERMAAGEHVVWLDYEQTAPHVVAMLLRVGADPDAVRKLLSYRSASGRPIALYVPLVRRVVPSLVVVDAMIGGLGAEGIDENDNGAVGRWIDRYLRALTRDRAGNATTTVLVLDHVPAEHKTGRRTTHNERARGASRKHDAADMTVEVHVLTPWSRERSGLLGLTVWKDRFGSWARGDRIAEVKVAPEEGGASVTLAVDVPSGRTVGGGFRPTVLMERISRWLELNPDATTRDVDSADNVRGNRAAKREALAALVAEGYVAVTHEGQTTRHRSTRQYREGDDETASADREADR